MARIVFEGEYVTLVNQAAGAGPGSIHDNARAQALGFRRGFVPGVTISLLVDDAIIQFFGKDWFEGGWHDMKFIAGAYDDEPVRVVLSEDGGPGYAMAVLTAEGRLTCGGRVGLGVDPGWDGASDGARAGRAFPASVLGTKLEPLEFTPRRAMFDRAISPGVAIPWFVGDSPFGGPLTPSCALLPATRHGQTQLSNEGVDQHGQHGMNGRMQMVFERPILLDRPYRAEVELVDKGESGRTWFRTIGYKLFHEGERYGFGRHTMKWWAPGELSQRISHGN